MLAYGYQKFGGPTVFEELPQSQLIPTDNQLLIKTLAVNLTEEDRLERLGTIQSVALPHILGMMSLGKSFKLAPLSLTWTLGQWWLPARTILTRTRFV